MLPVVTADAQGNQVRVVIVPPLAAELLVMDLQVLSGTTDLASPTIAAQHLFSELFVELGIKAQPGLFEKNPRFTTLPQSPRAEKHAVVRQAGI
jgi:hypothetical protein